MDSRDQALALTSGLTSGPKVNHVEHWKVLTDDILDKYLDSCSDDEMQIISIRKDHHESSAANRIAEAYFHKLKRSQNTNVKIFLYSLSNADDVCPKSLLSSR